MGEHDSGSWLERHFEPTLLNALAEINAKLDTILATLKEFQMSGTNSLANLTAQVASQQTVITSVETLLSQLTALIAAASPTGDNPAIDAIVTQLQTQDASLAAAVTANTPAAPAAPTTGGAASA
jgi:hypothetical protein